MKKVIFIAMLICLIFPSNKEKILTLNEPLYNIKSMKVNIDYSLGNLVIEAGQPDMAVTGYLKYFYQNIDGLLEYEKFGSTGILRLETEVDIDWDINYKNYGKNKVYNESELYLSPKIPLKMNVDVGMGKSTLSLQQLKIENFVLDCGMCETKVDFGEIYNPVDCMKIDVDAGLGSATLKNLLNSNSDQMEFECGLGTMNLEFGGQLKHDVEVDISVGLGAVNIEIPKGTNVIFKYDGSFLSSVDLDDFSNHGDEYRSRVINDANFTIYITGSNGAGSLKIKWIEN